MASAAITATSPAVRIRSAEDEVAIPRYATRATAAAMTRNSTHGATVTCTTAASSSDAYALVNAIPAGAYSAYANTIIQPVKNPPARPRPWLL